jgi:hypothetical protein
MGKDNAKKKQSNGDVAAPAEAYKHHGPTAGMSRRELFGVSFQSAAAMVTLPNLTSMLFSNTGFAQDLNCAVSEFKAGLPYICIDLAGGANIAGSNVAVGFVRDGTQLDYSDAGAFANGDYIRLGIPGAMHPSLPGMIDESYGLALHTRGGWYRGLESVLGMMPDVKKKVDGAIFCLQSFDDSSKNQLNSMYLAQKAGSRGKIAELVGTSNSLSGGNSEAPFDSVSLPIRPRKVAITADALTLLSLGASARSDYLGYNAAKAKERIGFVMEQIKKMNTARLRDFDKLSAAAQIQKQLGSTYQQAGLMLQQYSDATHSPAADPVISQIFGTQDQAAGAVSKLVLDHLAGAGTIVIGGCDYHDATNATGDAKDFQVGRTIGRIIAAAAAKGQSVLIHVFTDGGVTADSGGTLDSTTGKVNWTSDRGTRTASFLIAYYQDFTPGSNDEVRFVRKRQLGRYLRAGGTDLTATPFGNSLEAFAKVVAANILAASGRLGEYAAVYGRDLPGELLPYVVFEKLS